MQIIRECGPICKISIFSSMPDSVDIVLLSRTDIWIPFLKRWAKKWPVRDVLGVETCRLHAVILLHKCPDQ